ncbi:hypothetical protein [Beijerinckia sp. L45]|uniref:hypothetical protein n=1 Tax=Beijerinckia sp. L45 TaxID=1641855 RepID=UPI00131BD32B|nr:hypothetical protein [Beijerinckia sp. L45]
MTNFKTRTSLVAVAAAAVLSFGVSVANAQGFMPPNTDIRALEAPVDVTPNQLRAFGDKVYQGRSVAHDDAVQSDDVDR